MQGLAGFLVWNSLIMEEATIWIYWKKSNTKVHIICVCTGLLLLYIYWHRLCGSISELNALCHLYAVISTHTILFSLFYVFLFIQTGAPTNICSKVMVCLICNSLIYILIRKRKLVLLFILLDFQHLNKQYTVPWRFTQIQSVFANCAKSCSFLFGKSVNFWHSTPKDKNTKQRTDATYTYKYIQYILYVITQPLIYSLSASFLKGTHCDTFIPCWHFKATKINYQNKYLPWIVMKQLSWTDTFPPSA